MEVLIAGVLLLAILGLVGAVVPTFIESTNAAAVRSRLQQDALVILGRIEADLRLSSAPGIHVLPTPTPEPSSLNPDPTASPTPVPDVLAGFSVHLLKDGAYPGFQAWQDHLVLYGWRSTTRMLVRKRWPPTPPVNGPVISTVAPTACNDGDLVSILETPNGSEAIMSRSVRSFIFCKAMEPSPGTWRIKLELEEVVNSRRTEHLEAERIVLVRNTQ